MNCCQAGCVWSKYCKSIKPLCSANGTNRGTLFAIPYLPELIAALLSIMIFMMAGNKRFEPFAALDKAKLMEGNVVVNRSAYPWYVGNIAEKAKKRNAVFWTTFDKDLLRAWNDPPVAVAVTDADIVESFANHLDADGNLHTSLVNNTILPENFITMGKTCMCIGVLPAPLGPFFKTVSNAKSVNLHKKCTDARCIKIPNIAAAQSADLSRPVMAPAGQLNNMFTMIRLGCIFSILRLLAYLFCRQELQQPGSQWLSGWWAALFIWYGRAASNGFTKNVKKTPGPMLMWNRRLVPSCDKMPAGLWRYDYNLTAFDKKFHKLCLWAAIFNVMCQYFSTHAFCTDCSHYAYTNRNLLKYRRKIAAVDL